LGKRLIRTKEKHGLQNLKKSFEIEKSIFFFLVKAEEG